MVHKAQMKAKIWKVCSLLEEEAGGCTAVATAMECDVLLANQVTLAGVVEMNKLIGQIRIVCNTARAPNTCRKLGVALAIR